jgi:hypothetical protein
MHITATPVPTPIPALAPGDNPGVIDDGVDVDKDEVVLVPAALDAILVLIAL